MVSADEVIVPHFMLFPVVGGDSLQLEDGQAVQLEDGTTAYIHTPKGKNVTCISSLFLRQHQRVSFQSFVYIFM